MEVSYMKLKVVRGPVSDGSDIMRLVEEDGWVWAELWQGPVRGWVREIIEVGTVMSGHDTSRRLLMAHQVPHEDWPDDVD